MNRKILLVLLLLFILPSTFSVSNEAAGSSFIVLFVFIFFIVWASGQLFNRLNLPSFLGELIAGLIVGPTFLGVVTYDSGFQLLSDLGIFFLMFYAGLETDPKELKKNTKASILTAIGGAVLPFALGYFVTMLFGYTQVQALFVGMGLSITAIAVNIRVLSDYNIQKTRIGHVIIGAAIVDDVLALIIFSAILSIVKVNAVNFIEIGFIIAKVAIFFIVTIFVGYKLYPRLKHFFQMQKARGFTFALLIAALFGYLAESLGLHVILGAYFAGLFVREEVFSKEFHSRITDRMYAISYGLLGPIFFVGLGFHVTFNVFHVNLLPYLLTIIFVAIIGKVIGSGVMAYFSGLNIYEALAVGVGMNGRGAVELIVALVGLNLGVLNNELFSVLVFMALVTTFLTALLMKPVLHLLRKKRII